MTIQFIKEVLNVRNEKIYKTYVTLQFLSFDRTIQKFFLKKKLI